MSCVLLYDEEKQAVNNLGKQLQKSFIEGVDFVKILQNPALFTYDINQTKINAVFR